MKYLIALFLPFLAVMFAGRIVLGVILLIAQVTLVGWLPAVVVALLVIKDYEQKKMIKELKNDN